MSEDLIRRSDAIKAINGVGWLEDAEYEEKILAIPTIEPKQGEWIRISSLYSLDRTYRCSVCGKVIDDMPMDEYYDPAYKGCPYCLARMKGKDDENY